MPMHPLTLIQSAARRDRVKVGPCARFQTLSLEPSTSNLDRARRPGFVHLPALNDEWRMAQQKPYDWSPVIQAILYDWAQPRASSSSSMLLN
eukprot:scaffold170615_cov24-Tisochrysis_lutea.AAC.1